MKALPRSVSARVSGLWRERKGSVGVTVALLGCVVMAIMGSGYGASRALLSDGSSWLTRGKRAVHVNGSSGRRDAEIARDLARGDEAIQVVQAPDGNVYVVNKTTNEVRRLDLTAMDLDPNAGVAPSGPPQDVDLLASADHTYLVHRKDGRVELVDPVTLAVKGSVTVAGGIAEAVVDDKGSLWAVSVLGTLVQVEGGSAEPPVRVAAPGDQLTIAMVGDRPVVVNITAGAVVPVDPESRSLDAAINLPGPRGHKLVPNGPGNRSTRLWAARSDGTLVGVDLDRRHVDTVKVSDPGGSFGPPVVNNGRVYVPDYTHHTVVVVHAGELRSERTLAVSGTGPRFDVFAKDQAVWVNDATGSAALVIGADGTVKDVDKAGKGDKGDQSRQPQPQQPQPQPSNRALGGTTASPRASTGGLPAPARPVNAQPQSLPEPAPPPAAPTETKVPGVVGQLLEPACGAVRAERLDCSPVTTKSAPSGTRRGQVVGQQPAAGTRVRIPATVTVTVYDPDKVAVPPVIGRAPEEACAAVAQRGLVCQRADRGTAPPRTRPGEVTASSPAEDQMVEPNTTVTVSYFATAPAPDLGGKSPDQACTELQQLRLRCERRDAGRGRPAGQVTGQDPAAGTAVPRDAVVVIRYFSSAPKVPDVVGRAQEAACKAVRDAGFRCNPEVARNSTPPDEVFRQRPAGGQEADLGDVVTVFYEKYVTGRIKNSNPSPTGVWRNPNADVKEGEVPQGSAVTIVCRRQTGVAGDGWWYKILEGRSWPAGWITRVDVGSTNGDVPTC